MAREKLTRDEEIKRGVEKVERMNKTFDTLALPIILFTVVTIFIFGALPTLKEKLGLGESSSVSSVLPEQQSFYSRRESYMLDMQLHLEELTQHGYTTPEGYEAGECASLMLDDSTEVLEFSDNIGCYSIVRRSVADKPYTKLSIIVYSENIILAELVLAEGDQLSATFKNESFTEWKRKPVSDAELSQSDAVSTAERILEYVSSAELGALLEEYKQSLSWLP